MILWAVEWEVIDGDRNRDSAAEGGGPPVHD
jgi:hypothetical protein